MPFLQPEVTHCESITVKFDTPTNKLPRISHKDLQTAQLNDPEISKVIHFLERCKKPTSVERAREPLGCRQYLRQWEKLQLNDGILYRMKTTAEGISQQLILPQQLRNTAMTSLHDDLGHLGIDRTLEMVRH